MKENGNEVKNLNLNETPKNNNKSGKILVKDKKVGKKLCQVMKCRGIFSRGKISSRPPNFRHFPPTFFPD